MGGGATSILGGQVGGGPANNTAASFVGIETDFNSPKSQMNLNHKAETGNQPKPATAFTHNKNHSLEDMKGGMNLAALPKGGESLLTHSKSGPNDDKLVQNYQHGRRLSEDNIDNNSQDNIESEFNNYRELNEEDGNNFGAHLAGTEGDGDGGSGGSRMFDHNRQKSRSISQNYVQDPRPRGELKLPAIDQNGMSTIQPPSAEK